MPCILLRETYRADGKVKHRTLANFSKLPAEVLAGLRSLLKVHRDTGPTPGGITFRITRSRPHGHVAAVLVGDRGMITQARIDEELRDVEGLDWISALRSSASICDTGLTFQRRADHIAREAAIDGIDVIRTSLGESQSPKETHARGNARPQLSDSTQGSGHPHAQHH